MLWFIEHEELEVVLDTIFLIRHGEVKWNRENSYIGSTDLPLNAHGRSQAGLVAECLAGRNVSAVYSSDLVRARETAEIIAARLGLPVDTVPDLREVDYGEWEGLTESEVRERYPEVFVEWRLNPSRVRIPGGETFAELRDRAFPAFCRIAQAHAGENIAVVAHKSTNRVILCSILGVDINHYRRIGQGNSALNVIETRKDGRMVVEAINESGHLLVPM